VELWFAELINHEPRRPAHRSVTRLEAGTGAWITARNTDPEPFVSIKTAGEILGLPAAYCRRINNSAHKFSFLISTAGIAKGEVTSGSAWHHSGFIRPDPAYQG